VFEPPPSPSRSFAGERDCPVAPGRQAGEKKKEDEVGGCETDKKGKNEKRRDEGKMEPNELIYSTELGLGCIGGKSVIGKTY
jgi:hypothetical protein